MTRQGYYVSHNIVLVHNLMLMAETNKATPLKHSVITTLGKALAVMLSLALLISLVSIFMLSSTINDGTSINLAGSLRMQSYRIAYELQAESPNIPDHLAQFENTLLKSAVMLDKNWVLPKSIHGGYKELLSSWRELGESLYQEDKEMFFRQLSGFVNQIDAFVYSLEKHTQKKLENLAIFSAVGLSLILFIALFLLRFAKNEIIYPLNRLMTASRLIQKKAANIQLTPINKKNELSELINTFCQMNHQINSFYQDLEIRITNKTQRLTKANQTLDLLYQCATHLSSQFVTQSGFEQILSLLLNAEGIMALHLDVNNQQTSQWQVKKSSPHYRETDTWHSLTLETQNTRLGFLHWQGDAEMIDPLLITNIGLMLSRAINSNQLYKQVLHNAVMEERNSFARELHDSIAQSLSYLKIQNNLLKKQLKKNDVASAELLSDEIQTQLNTTYEQLRELITAFRVSLTHSDFGLALHEMRDSLQPKTQANIGLSIEDISIHPEQQTHVLHIIREACCNAIKHAEATQIDISCKQTDACMTFEIKDNGKGFHQMTSKEEQYGLVIMQERTYALGGHFAIHTSPHQGCHIVIELNKNHALTPYEESSNV